MGQGVVKKLASDGVFGSDAFSLTYAGLPSFTFEGDLTPSCMTYCLWSSSLVAVARTFSAT